MGNLMTNNSTKTEKGNFLYEFKRISSEELADYRISVYDYID